MRISDWSSDVCSSDLLAGEARYLCPSRPPGCRSPGLAANAPASARRGAGEADPRRQPQSGDRKSVGQGKSVSVRVDLGGRRIIKKKTKRNCRYDPSNVPNHKIKLHRGKATVNT